jgi:DNA-binding NtrC family response regulator
MEQGTRAVPDVLNVLIIDDDPTQVALLEAICGSQDYPTVSSRSAATGREGLSLLAGSQVDLVLTDYRLPDMNGLDVLGEVKAVNPLVSVVIMTAFENAREAVAILKAGADDYLIKPTAGADISHLLVRAHERLTLHREEGAIRAEIEQSFGTSEVVFKSRAIMSILQTAARSAASDTTVLITGESGTGKELIARMIHRTGRRADKPFVTVNISALSESLVESELFGHRKGSYTGATEDRVGRFEQANRGTIFIDEIGDITPSLQVKLLRTIQFGEVQRIGENELRRLDVRIIAATNRDLEAMVKDRAFRADLYYRLNVIPIKVPALRQRREDIPVLVDSFIARFNAKHGASIVGISREAMDALMRHDFPGNVRELENLVERAVVLARGETLLRRDFPDVGGPGPGAAPEPNSLPEGAGSLEDKVRAFETGLVTEALEKTRGNQSRAAEALGISERHLRSRMEKLGIQNIWK